MDAAIQHLTFATSTVYGEWALDPTMGSFISEYYWNNKDDLNTLSRLIKLEFIRLSLIPIFDNNMDNQNPKTTLGYVKKIDKVTVDSAKLIDHRLNVNIELIWGNNEKWSGNLRLWINILK